jgi:hypothetical protein
MINKEKWILELPKDEDAKNSFDPKEIGDFYLAKKEGIGDTFITFYDGNSYVELLKVSNINNINWNMLQEYFLEKRDEYITSERRSCFSILISEEKNNYLEKWNADLISKKYIEKAKKLLSENGYSISDNNIIEPNNSSSSLSNAFNILEEKIETLISKISDEDLAKLSTMVLPIFQEMGNMAESKLNQEAINGLKEEVSLLQNNGAQLWENKSFSGIPLENNEKLIKSGLEVSKPIEEQDQKEKSPSVVLPILMALISAGINSGHKTNSINNLIKEAAATTAINQ